MRVAHLEGFVADADVADRFELEGLVEGLVRQAYRCVDFFEQLLVLLFLFHAREALLPELRVQAEVFAETQPLSCAQRLVVVFVAVEGAADLGHLLLLRVEDEDFFQRFFPAAFGFFELAFCLALRFSELLDLLL